MYIDLKKTIEEISSCLPEKGVPTSKQLQRMYELTLRLQSQELAVIYDMEARRRRNRELLPNSTAAGKIGTAS